LTRIRDAGRLIRRNPEPIPADLFPSRDNPFGPVAPRTPHLDHTADARLRRAALASNLCFAE